MVDCIFIQPLAYEYLEISEDTTYQDFIVLNESVDKICNIRIFFENKIVCNLKVKI